MEGNFAEKPVETKSVQPLFDELEKELTFLPNDEAKKAFINLFTYILSM